MTEENKEEEQKPLDNATICLSVSLFIAVIASFWEDLEESVGYPIFFFIGLGLILFLVILYAIVFMTMIKNRKNYYKTHPKEEKKTREKKPNPLSTFSIVFFTITLMVQVIILVLVGFDQLQIANKLQVVIYITLGIYIILITPHIIRFIINEKKSEKAQDTTRRDNIAMWMGLISYFIAYTWLFFIVSIVGIFIIVLYLAESTNKEGRKSK